MVSLTSGILFLCLGVLGFVVTLLGARNPRSPRWASDFLIGSVYAPGIIALVVFGFATLVQVGFAPLASWRSVAEIGPAVAILVGTAAVIKFLRPRKTLAAFRARCDEAGAGGTTLRSVPSADGDRPEPPVKPTRPRLAA